jgi:two-component system sensor histidine kinase ResE
VSSIFGRLFGSYLAVIVVTLVVVYLATAYLFADYYFAARETELLREAQARAGILAAEEGRQRLRPGGHLLSMLEERLVVLDRRQIEARHPGRGPGPRSWLGPEECSRLLAGETTATRRYVPHIDKEVLAVAAPIRHDGEVTGAVLVFAPVSDLDATVTAVRRITLSAAGVAVLLAMGLSFRLSRSLSEPILEMSRVSVDMARGRFDRRVPLQRRDEIGQLAENLNLLAGSLDRSIGELAREKGKLESVVANMAEGVVAVDSGGEVILTNAPARSYLKNGTVPELTALFEAVLAKGERSALEMELDGVHLLAQCTPLRHGDGAVFGAVAVIQDITALRRLEQMRRDFVANVSHELRTPLTAIQGIIEGLIDGVISEAEAGRYLRVAHGESLRMNRLVQDLLDLAALEAGRTDWELHAVELPEILDRLETRLQAPLSEKGLAVRREVPPDLPPLPANESRLEQVLTNLVENAARFSPPGGVITVTAERRPDNRITVTVRDQGPGIPPEDLPHVWERFYRVEKSRARESGGTGLGLAIVRQIVEAQGGEVAVESSPGEGASFSFTLPAAENEGPGP